MQVLPDFIETCCARLRAEGHKAHPVGGCVRDLLLGRQPEDWDVATSARPEEVMAIFGHTVPTGVRHGTVTVLLDGGRAEVTTFRREEGYADRRHPDRVAFDAGLTEDLSRRDFTMNAMALDSDRTLIDPFGGRNDLAQKKIRCVGDPAERFSEDALRMLRAVRFSAQLGFEIETDTAAAIAVCAAQTAHLSAERVRAEVEKTILAPWPGRGNGLFSMGLLDRWLEEPVFPDLNALSPLPLQPLYRWGGLCALLGGTGFLDRLKPDRRTYAVCKGILRALGEAPPQTDADWRRALARHGTEVTAVAAAITGRQRLLGRVLAARPCFEQSGLALTGGELAQMGFRGVEIGAARRKLLEHVLEYPRDNNPTALRQLARSFQEVSNNFSNRT